MSRVEENAEVLKKTLKTKEIMHLDDGVFAELLADISKSLAVIADGIDDVKDYVNE